MRKFDSISGTVLLVFFLLFSAFGDPLADPLFAVLALTFGLAGGLFFLGGLVDGVSVGRYRVQWYVFSGTATAMIGLSLSISLFFAPQLDGAAGEAFSRIIAIANALVFGYMGFDIARGGGRADGWSPQEVGG